MQGLIIQAKVPNAGGSFAKAALTTASRASAQALRPQAPAFVGKAPSGFSHTVRTHASAAVADAPAPSVASTSDRESQPGTPGRQRPASDSPVLFKFILPAAAVGPLMGHNAENVVAIRAATGASVQVARPGTATASDRDRLLMVGGEDLESVKAAVAAVLSTLEREGAADRLRKQGYPGKVFLKMVIPAPAAGRVLGPGGETIAELCTRTKCNVVVEAKPANAAFVPFRFVNFLSSSTAVLGEAVAAAMDLVFVDERYMAGIREITSVSFRVVEVPEKRVGSILGPGGAHIQALQELLRCKIGVCDTSRKPGSRFVSVWGPPAHVRIALDVVAACTGGLGDRGRATKQVDDDALGAYEAYESAAEE